VTSGLRIERRRPLSEAEAQALVPLAVALSGRAGVGGAGIAARGRKCRSRTTARRLRDGATDS
jgi:hypothetical protein